MISAKYFGSLDLAVSIEIFNFLNLNKFLIVFLALLLLLPLTILLLPALNVF